MSKSTSPPCVVIFGGSFDPVHIGHVTLAEGFVHLFKPDEVCLIPTGWSQQKRTYRASPKQRVDMLSFAFAKLAKMIPVVIDEQEIERAKLGIPSYTIDTLTSLRQKWGNATSLILCIGADQLQQFQHWKNWHALFNLAHIAVATRPGFEFDTIDPCVAKEFKQRASNVEQLRQQPCGYTYWWTELAVDVTSTQIRNGINLTAVPPDVLHYIQQHNIY